MRCIMGSFSIWHWIVVLIVVLAVFGTAKLRNIGGDLGTALKGFKDAMKEDEKKKSKKLKLLSTKQKTVKHLLKKAKKTTLNHYSLNLK